MTEIIYDKLTPEEIDFMVTNNCGSKKFDVPDFSFVPACQRHDVDYWIGGNKKDRLMADLRFFYNMKSIVNDMPWYRRLYMRLIPWAYYYGVRIGGSSRFYWGIKRTYEKLKYAMSIAAHSTKLPKNWDDYYSSKA